ncbi:MAG: rhombosortase [Verrucomicrobia bacterium]|nr:rhombosortase [Verrucomicrobiota bacterium]
MIDRSRFPWATAALAGAAALLMLVPAAGPALGYDRAAIFSGQLWRLWTGHFLHFGAAHFGWNAAVFTVAGAWVETVAPGRARWFYGLAPAIVSAVLLGFEPALALFGGLSGLATGLVVLLALDRLKAGGREPRGVWLAVLGLVAAKQILEWVAGAELFVVFEAGVRPVPLAHLAGALTAVGVFFVTQRRPQKR